MFSFLKLIKRWDCQRCQEHANGFSSSGLEIQLPAFHLRIRGKMLSATTKTPRVKCLVWIPKKNARVCLEKVVQQGEQERALDIPPVNRESRGFSCLTVLLSNCGAWLQDFIVTGHRGKRDFGSSLMLSKFRLNETGKPFRQRKHSLHVKPCLSSRLKPGCFGQPDTCSRQIGGHFWWEGLWKSSLGHFTAMQMTCCGRTNCCLSRVCGEKNRKQKERESIFCFSVPKTKTKWKTKEAFSWQQRVNLKRYEQHLACFDRCLFSMRCTSVPWLHLSNSWWVSVTQLHSADLWLSNAGNQATESPWKTLCLWCWLKEFFISSLVFIIILQEDVRGWKGSTH